MYFGKVSRAPYYFCEVLNIIRLWLWFHKGNLLYVVKEASERPFVTVFKSSQAVTNMVANLT